MIYHNYVGFNFNQNDISKRDILQILILEEQDKLYIFKRTVVIRPDEISLFHAAVYDILKSYRTKEYQSGTSYKKMREELDYLIFFRQAHESALDQIKSNNNQMIIHQSI